MIHLFVRFTVTLRPVGAPDGGPIGPFGPWFHRWLPDGRKEAIQLKTDAANVSLEVWFERRGETRPSGGPIEFSMEKRAVDPEVMARQAVLEAGPLEGLLQLRDAADEGVTDLRNGNYEGEACRQLLKRVVKAIGVPVGRFVNVIRVVYGQFWVRPLEPWDSRTASLESYCSRLLLRWSEDGSKWDGVGNTFSIKDPGSTIVATPPTHDYRDYLTRESWGELARVGQEGYEPSLAATTLFQANRLLDEGKLRSAFLEAGTAFELAASEKFEQFAGGSSQLMSYSGSFFELPEPTKLVVLAGALPAVRREDVELAAKAISIRNRVAHEGYTPRDRDEDKLKAFIRVIGRLISGPRFRSVELSSANAVRPDEAWREIYRRSGSPPGA
jgi:hypothetical protein